MHARERSELRRVRLAAAGGAVAGLVVAFGLLGGVAMGTAAPAPQQYEYGKKAAVCHKGKTIVVSANAVPAHLRHGDTLGSCAPEPEPAKAKHQGTRTGRGR